MPQFDIGTFASQIFWLAVCMMCLYVFMSKISVPGIASILEKRQERINADLHKADEMQLSALNLQAEYEQIMTEAREQSNKTVMNSLSETQSVTAKRRKDINATIQSHIKFAEDRVERKKNQSNIEIKAIAETIVRSIVQKTVNLDVPQNYLNKTLDESLGKKPWSKIQHFGF